MDFTDLTKVMLQGRRFFRPFDLETRGLRRILHPFAGAISAIGFAIAAGTFIWNDIVRNEEKDVVLALNKAGIDFQLFWRIDELTYKVDEVNARLQPKKFTEDDFPLPRRQELYVDMPERIDLLKRALPNKAETENLAKELKPLDSKFHEIEDLISDVEMSFNLSDEEKREHEKNLYLAAFGIESLIQRVYLDFFDREREKSQKYLDFVTQVSYWLYALGLMLGLSGQFVGVKPEGIDWEP